MTKIKKQPWYGILMAFTVIMTLSAVITLIPDAAASKLCPLGYKAHCSFTPWSTIISLFLAMISCKIRSKWFTIKSND